MFKRFCWWLSDSVEKLAASSKDNKFMMKLSTIKECNCFTSLKRPRLSWNDAQVAVSFSQFHFPRNTRYSIHLFTLSLSPYNAFQFQMLKDLISLLLFLLWLHKKAAYEADIAYPTFPEMVSAFSTTLEAP